MVRRRLQSSAESSLTEPDLTVSTRSEGLGHEGIYRKNGAKSRIKLLMDEFRRDARNVKLRIGDHFIEDVTDVLKRFFREVDDPIFMADLHPLWQEAASESKFALDHPQSVQANQGLPCGIWNSNCSANANVSIATLQWQH